MDCPKYAQRNNCKNNTNPQGRIYSQESIIEISLGIFIFIIGHGYEKTTNSKEYRDSGKMAKY
jgi:hypothetical protein